MTTVPFAPSSSGAMYASRGEVAAGARFAVHAGTGHAVAPCQRKFQHMAILLDARMLRVRQALGELAGASLHLGVVGAGGAVAQHVHGNAGHGDHARARRRCLDARVRVRDGLRRGAQCDVGRLHSRRYRRGRFLACYRAFGHLHDERPMIHGAGGFVEQLAHLAGGVVGDDQQRLAWLKRKIRFDNDACTLL